MLKFNAALFAIAGLIAAGAPILIHLLNRRRYRVIDWAAMDFLREAMQRSRRVLQLRDLILLILRILCVLLFGLALAQPYFAQTDEASLARYIWVGLAVVAAFGFALWAVVSSRSIARWVGSIACGIAAIFACWGLYDLGQLASDESAKTQRDPVHAILIVDNSLSMGYQTLDDTLLDQAKARTRAFIDKLPEGSRVNILPLCGPRSAYSIEPYRTKDDARDALDRIELVDRRGGMILAAALAREAQDKAPDIPTKRVVFIGDQQRGDWSKSQLGELSDLPEMQVVRVAATAAENAWIESVAVQDGLADATFPATLLVTVRYEGAARKTNLQVSLDVDGVPIASQTIDLEPGQRRELAFTHKFDEPADPSQPAWSKVRAYLTPDSLPGDDERHVIVPVLSRLPVVFIDQYGPRDENPRQNRFGETYDLRKTLGLVAQDDGGGDSGAATVSATSAALASGEPDRAIAHTTPSAICRTREEAEADDTLTPLDNARLVVLAGVAQPDEEAVKLLREFVLQGGQLLIAAGADFSPAAWQQAAWNQGAGILPLPLSGEVVGSLPSEASGDLEPFFLDFASLKDNRLFQIENEDPAYLADLYRSPDIFFFKAVETQAAPELFESIASDELKRIGEEREFVAAAAERAAAQAEGRLTETDRALVAVDREQLDALRPRWLAYRQEFDDSRPLAELVNELRPAVHAAFTNGLPFIAERKLGQGRVVFVSTGVTYDSAGRFWSTLTNTNAKVIYDRLMWRMIHDTLPKRDWPTQEEIALDVPGELRGSRVVLTRPDGEEKELRVDALGDFRSGVRVPDAVQRGVYTLTAYPKPELAAVAAESAATEEPVTIPLAVAGPAAESDPLPLTREEFQALLAESETGLATKVHWVGPGEEILLEGAGRSGQNFWWKALLIAVLVLLFVEILVLAAGSIGRDANVAGVDGAGSPSSPGRAERFGSSRAVAAAAPARAGFKGFAVVMLLMIVGVAVSSIAESGKTNWIWLGAGVGAGLGVFIAQALGWWPKKQR